MTTPDDSMDSLDRDVTFDGLGEPPAAADSLGDELTTGGDTPSSMSDLTGFDEAWDGAEEIIDFDSRYEVLDRLGRGGMGEVVQALDRRLQRRVAVKRLHDTMGHSRKAIQRFLTEARAIAALNHFNVVQVYDFGRDRQGHYIVMELVDGQSLSQYLRSRGKLEPAEAVEIVAQVCSGLSLAHSRGIIHRDIKPANILLTESGIPKLTDFGLARLDDSDDGQTKTGAVLGTVDFMAPEQRRDARGATAASDIWSLAATLYQIVTGDSPRVIRSDRLPIALAPVLLKALEDEPEQRYSSADEFREALMSAQAAAIETAAVNLVDGQCPQCGRQNDLSHEFCVGCGGSLRESCPGCTQPLPIWARFCGKCGADVKAKLAERLRQLKNEKQKIDSLRAQSQYAEVEKRLKKILRLKHSAFADYRRWAQTTLKQVQSELGRMKQQRDKLLEAAELQFSQCAYSAALRYLRQIPEAVRDEAVRKLEAMSQESLDELREVGTEIQLRLDGKMYDGLLPLVERYLQLKPEDTQANELLKRLTRRGQQKPAKKLQILGDSPAAGVGDSETQLGRQPLPSAPQESGGLLVIPSFRRQPLRVLPVSILTAIPPWVHWIAWSLGTVVLLIVLAGTALDGLASASRRPRTAGLDSGSRDQPPVSGRPLSPATGNHSSGGGASTSFVTAPSRAFAPQPQAEVQCMDVSPDLRYWMTGHSNGTVLLSRMSDAKLERQVGICLGTVTAVAFLNNTEALSANAARGVQRWELRRSQQTRSYSSESIVWCLAASPDGRYALSGEENGKVRYWNVQTDAELFSSRLHNGAVTSCAISADGLTAATGGRNGTIQIWDLHPQRMGSYRTIRAETQPVTCLALSYNGRSLAVGRSDEIEIYDSTIGQRTASISGHRSWVSDIRFSPNALYVLSGSNDRTVRLWDVGTRRELFSRDEPGLIADVRFGSRSQIVSCTVDGIFHGNDLYDSANQSLDFTSIEPETSPMASTPTTPSASVPKPASPVKLPASPPRPDEETNPAIQSFQPPTPVVLPDRQVVQLGKHQGPVCSVAFSPDNRFVASASGSGDGNLDVRFAVELWDAVAGRHVRRLGDQVVSFRKVRFSPDGRLVAASDRAGGRVQVWETETGELQYAVSLADLPVTKYLYDFAILPGENQLLLGTGSGVVRMRPDGSDIEYMDRRFKTACAMDLSRDAARAVVGMSQDRGAIAVVNLQTNVEQGQISVPARQIDLIAISGDGSRAISQQVPSETMIWDVQACRLIRTLPRNESLGRTIAISPDGRLAATSNSQGLWYVWSTVDGDSPPLQQFSGSNALAFDFSATSTHVAVGCEDGAVQIFQLSAKDQTGGVPSAAPTPGATGDNAANAGDRPDTTAPPAIQDFNPKEGREGTEITIVGSGLAKTQSVFFCNAHNRYRADFATVSDTQLKVTAPVGVDELGYACVIEVTTPVGVTITIPEERQIPFDAPGRAAMLRTCMSLEPDQPAPAKWVGSVVFVASGASVGQGVGARFYVQQGATITSGGVGCRIHFVSQDQLQFTRTPSNSRELFQVRAVYPSYVGVLFRGLQ